MSLAVRKTCPLASEVPAQLLKIVTLAVVDDANGAVLVCHRLMPARDIDDREPRVADADRTVDVHAVIVGPAVLKRVEHCRQDRRPHRCGTIIEENSGNAAHLITACRLTARRPPERLSTTIIAAEWLFSGARTLRERGRRDSHGTDPG